MVEPTRVNYYLVVAGGLFFLTFGLYNLYEGLVPASYYSSLDAIRTLSLGAFQAVFGLVWLYIAYRSGGRLAISGGRFLYEK
jgi:hypothetical protein